MRFLATRRFVFSGFVFLSGCVQWRRELVRGRIVLSFRANVFFGAKSFEQMKKKARQSPDSLRGL